MCSSLPVSQFLWHLWPARNWPFAPVEERLFVDDLVAACAAPSATGDAAEFDRGDATAVLNSLRCGLSWDGLAGFVPGADPRRLLAAYRALDKARAVSTAAFEQLLADTGACWFVGWFGSRRWPCRPCGDRQGCCRMGRLQRTGRCSSC